MNLLLHIIQNSQLHNMDAFSALFSLLVLVYPSQENPLPSYTEFSVSRPCLSADSSEQCAQQYECNIKLVILQASYDTSTGKQVKQRINETYCNYNNAVDDIIRSRAIKEDYCKIINVSDAHSQEKRFKQCNADERCQNATYHFKVENTWYQPFKCSPWSGSAVCATRYIHQVTDPNQCHNAVRQGDACHSNAACLEAGDYGHNSQMRYHCNMDICKTIQRLPNGTAQTQRHRACNTGQICTRYLGNKRWPDCIPAEAYGCETLFEFQQREYEGDKMLQRFGTNAKPCRVEMGGHGFDLEQNKCGSDSVCVLLNQPLYTDNRNNNNYFHFRKIDDNVFINEYYCFNVRTLIPQVLRQRAPAYMQWPLHGRLCGFEILASNLNSVFNVPVYTQQSVCPDSCSPDHYDYVNTAEWDRPAATRGNNAGKYKHVYIPILVYRCAPITHIQSYVPNYGK